MAIQAIGRGSLLSGSRVVGLLGVRFAGSSKSNGSLLSLGKSAKAIDLFPDKAASVPPKEFRAMPRDAKPHPASVVSPGFRAKPTHFKRRLPAYDDKKKLLEVMRSTMSSMPHWHEYRPYPIDADFLVIGGGLVGSSIAYFISRRTPQCKVVVIERDHTYAQSGPISAGFGTFRTQFTLDENVALAMSSLDLLRDDIPNRLLRRHVPQLHVPFHHQPFLILHGDEHHASENEEAVQMQNQLGANVALLNKRTLSSEFPWISTEGVLFATMGLENEGWVDPYDLLGLLRARASSHGAQFIQGYVVGFDKLFRMGSYTETMTLTDVLAIDGQQNLRPIRAGRIIVAAGNGSTDVSNMAAYGGETISDDVSRYPIPLTPFTRKLYVLRGLGLPFNCPIIADPTGIVFTRPDGWPEGYALVCEPIPNRIKSSLTVTNSANANSSKPSEISTRSAHANWLLAVLAQRLNEDLSHVEIVGVRNSAIDLNYFDSNWILGKHPFIERLYFACGSNGNSAVHCLALGRAMAELQFYKSFRTLEMGRFSPERLMSEQMVIENIVV